MSVKLKPCPFCGGKARPRDIQQDEDGDYYVWCFCAGAGPHAHSKYRAVQRWNERANPTGAPRPGDGHGGGH